MGNLSAFLHPDIVSEKEVYISDRFKENGEVVPFKIRPITQAENESIMKRCRVTTRDRSGKEIRKLDTEKFMNSIVVAGTVVPDFSDKDLCDAYGVVDPNLVPGKMLLAGEFQKLTEAIMELSGIGDDAEEAIVEEAKN